MRRAAAEEGERESLMGEEVGRLTAGLTELALMAALLTGFSPFGVASADALEPHTVFFVPVQIGGAGLNRLSMGWACTSQARDAEAEACSSSRAAVRFGSIER